MATGNNTKTSMSLQLGETSHLFNDSLQTPDTSSLFISDISNEADATLVFQDRAAPITSLEELLNVTGINQSEEVNLSEIAREVDAQHGMGLAGHLSVSHGHKRTLSQDSLQCSDPSTGMIPTKQPKVDLKSGVETHSRQIDPTTLNTSTVLRHTKASDLKSTAQYNSVVCTFSQETTEMPTLSDSNEDQRNIHIGLLNSRDKSLNGIGLSDQTSLKPIKTFNPSDQPLPNSRLGGSASSTLCALTSAGCLSAPSTVSISPVVLSTISSGGTSSSLLGTTTGIPNQVNRGNLVLQLVQLYRQYQQLGDNQGMAKVKQQLSTFLSTQNNKPNSTTLLFASPSIQPQSTLPLPQAASQSTNVGANPTANPSTTMSSTIIGTSTYQPLAPKPSLTAPIPTPIGQKVTLPAKQTSQFSVSTPVLYSPGSATVSSSLAQTKITSSSVISSTRPPECLAQLNPSRSDSAVSSLLPSQPLSSTMPSTSTFTSASSQEVLKSVYVQRVKQIQSFIQSLPMDQKPRNINDLKELLKRYNVSFQLSAATFSSSPNELGNILSSTVASSAGPSSSTSAVLSQTALSSVQSFSATSQSSKMAFSLPLLSSSGSVTAFAIKPGTSAGMTQPLVSAAAATKANVSSSTTGKSVQLQSLSSVAMTPASNSRLPTTTLAPIQPGMVTPLPPGLNLEALARLCSLPDNELAKHNLPSGLLSAIKVWKQQQQKNESQFLLSRTAEATSPDIPVLIPKEDKIFGATAIGIPVARLMPLVTSKSAVEAQQSSVLTSGNPSSLPCVMATKSVLMPSDKSSITKTFADSKDHFAQAMAGMQSPMDISVLSSCVQLSGSPSTTMQSLSVQLQPHYANTAKLQSESDGVSGLLSGRVAIGSTIVGSLTDANSPLLAHLSTLRTQRQGMPLQKINLGTHQPSQHALVTPDSSKLPTYSASLQLTQNRSSMASVPTGNRPLTRYQAKVEHARAEHERIQTIQKILQSSDEAKIAFRIQNHLDKMRNQVVNPDMHTPFQSFQDVLVRLLPYHVLSEPEPAPGTMEKVVESVAQILMSRSKGLISRYQQVVLKDAQLEHDKPLCILLDKLFIEAENERVAQENRERQQAAQIAADLSLIAGDDLTDFDNDFSLGDMLNDDPMFNLDSGIT